MEACPTHHVFGFWAGLALTRLSLPLQVTPLSSNRVWLQGGLFAPFAPFRCFVEERTLLKAQDASALRNKTEADYRALLSLDLFS